MKKIIHLSDTHVGFAHCQSHLNRVVTNLILKKQPAADYVIILSGDLVEDGTRDGLFETALVEVNRLRKAGYEVLVCPGNHDYGTGSNGDKNPGNPDKQSPHRVIDLRRDARFDYDGMFH